MADSLQDILSEFGGRSTDAPAIVPSQNLESIATEFDKAAPAAAQVLAQQKAPFVRMNPTEGNSFWQNSLEGAGKSFADIGRSVDYLTGISRLWGGTPTTQADIDEARKLDESLIGTGGGLTGFIGGNVASTVLPLGAAAKGAQALGLARTGNVLGSLALPQTYKAAGTIGALQGGLLTPAATQDAAQSSLFGKEVSIPGQAVNAAKGFGGGLVGNAAVNAIGRVARPVGDALGNAARNAVDILESAGVPLDAAQKTGSAFLGRLKASLGDNMWTAGKQADFSAEQKSAFARAALKTIGEDADAATPQVMGAAKQRLGDAFEQITSRNPIRFDNALQAELAQAELAAGRTLTDSQRGVIAKQLENILTKARDGSGAIDGKAAQVIKTELDHLSLGSDQSIGHVARAIREAMDNGLERSTAANGNAADFAALQVARKQYRNMKMLEQAVDKEGGGTLSPARLAQVFHTKANRNASVYGRGDTELAELAHAGNMILREKLPNSGTNARALANFLGLPGVIGGAEYARSGDPQQAIGAAAAAAAIPKAAQFAINNQGTANYLARGMQGPMQSVGNALLLPQTNTTIGALMRRGPASPTIQNSLLPTPTP